jgi:hypothetical protein
MNDELQAQAASPVPSVSRKRRGEFLAFVIFLWAFWMGWVGWKDLHSKSQASSPEQWEDKTISPRVAVLRQQLATIEARPIKTVDDYMANTLETGPIVGEGKGLVRQQMAMIARFKQVHQDKAVDMRTADYMIRLTEKDEQLMYLLADEIKCAEDLESLPAAARLSYYNANVPSIKDKEAQVMKEWLAIAKDAKENGIPLPASGFPD